MSSAAGCGSPCRMELGRFMWAGHSRGLTRAWCEGSFCHLWFGKEKSLLWEQSAHVTSSESLCPSQNVGVDTLQSTRTSTVCWQWTLNYILALFRSSLWTWGAWLGRLWCKQKIFLCNSSIFFSEIWIILLWVAVSEVLSKSAELATWDREHEIAALLQWIETILFSANMLWQEECWWHSNQ